MAMAATASMEPSLDVDKLSYEIFSILESKFLFGYDAGSSPATKSPAIAAGKVRILSIDGGFGPCDGLPAAAALADLESALQRRSGDPDARIADFFDVAAGSGAGGVLAALLFTRSPSGRPLLSAAESLSLLTKWRRRRGIFRRILRRSGGGMFRRALGDLTLRDALKPVLIPCYDLATGAPFLFSRADAVEIDGYDFRMREVCAATCAGDRAVEMRSADGRTPISAVGGAAAAMGNPAAAAITHVLNNKHEFPLAAGVGDLLVVSIGGDQAANLGVRSPPPAAAADIARIAGECAADMVDQAVAMAFGHNRATNYLRIQANGMGIVGKNRISALATPMMEQRNVESVLFEGKKISEQSNGERLEWFSGELIKEHERRKMSPVPNVIIKQAMTPRTSSATTLTTITTATATTSTEPESP